MFLRIVRGTPTKPGPRGQFVIGLVAIVVGATYLGTLVVDAVASSRPIDQSGMAAVMILVAGIVWSRHAWKQLRTRGA